MFLASVWGSYVGIMKTIIQITSFMLKGSSVWGSYRDSEDYHLEYILAPLPSSGLVEAITYSPIKLVL